MRYTTVGRMWEHARWVTSSCRHLVGTRRALLPLVAPGADRRRLAYVACALGARIMHIPAFVPRLALTLATGRNLVTVSSHNELAGAAEVLCTQHYDARIDPMEVRHVVDLGANVGFATMLFAARYPEADVVAVEPDPDTYHRLVSNVGQLVNVRPLQLAVGEPGVVVFDGHTPSTEQRGSVSGTGVRVQRVALDQLLGIVGWGAIDVLKLDIEGDEFAVLAQSSAIARVRVIVGELHLDSAPADWGGVEAVLAGFHVELSSRESVYPMFRAMRR